MMFFKKRLTLPIGIGLLAMVTFMAVFTGCKEKESSQKAAAVVKDELVMSMGIRPGGQFDPKKRWGLYSQSQILHDTLLTKTAELEIVGDLAKDYSVSDDGLIWTFNLRDDYKFSTGEPVTAEDVEFTYKEMKADGISWDLSFLEKIEIKDKNRILFYLSEPRSTFFAQLTEIVILPRNHYDENYSLNPIGSGPYKLIQWDRGQQAIFELNPYYAGPKPHFKKFTLLFLDENAALAAAKAGSVDMIYILPEFAEERIPGWKLFSYESNDVREISMPTKRAGYGKTPQGYPIGNSVTSDVAIRRALYIGLDRQQMVDVVLNGHGKKAFSLCDEMPWFNREMIAEDSRVADAINILTEAGWVDSNGDGIRERDGLKAEFDLYHAAADGIRTGLSIVAAEQAAKLGIKINLVGTNWDEIKQKMHSNAVLFAGGRHHPHQIYTFLHPSMAGIGYNNIVYYDNPEVTKHLDLAMSSPSIEDSFKHWKNVQWDGKNGINHKGDVPFIWLVRLDHIHLGDKRINVGKQPIHTHGHEWSLLANIAEWTWSPEA